MADEPRGDEEAPPPVGEEPATDTPRAGRARADDLQSVVEALPGVVRLASATWLRSAAWGMGATARSSKALARTLTNPETAGQVAEELARELSGATRVVSEVSRSVADGVPLTRAVTQVDLSPQRGEDEAVVPDPAYLAMVDQPDLRGEMLLQRSRDVWSLRDPHPSYEKIVDQLAPDEARILLLLTLAGPQACVDVRSAGPGGLLSSTLIANCLNMIGLNAGVRYIADTPAYLNNLERLGMVWSSREQVDDPLEYQLLEAQPDVLEAIESVRFTKTVRRSVHLTPFGQDFARTCLIDPDESPAPLAAHDHSAPERS